MTASVMDVSFALAESRVGESEERTLSEAEEAGNVGVGEGVVARLDRGHARGLESGGEEADVRRLVGGDLLEERVETGVAGSLEVGGRELGERLGVVDVLEVLQREDEGAGQLAVAR